MLKPCVRESKAARLGRFLRRKLSPAHGLFFSYKDQQREAKGWDSWGDFEGYTQCVCVCVCVCVCGHHI